MAERKRMEAPPTVCGASNRAAFGAETAIYLFNYAITLSTGRKLTYPVELLTFQVNRAVGTLEYNFIFSPDGRKPCQCELDEARLVSSRLYRT